MHESPLPAAFITQMRSLLKEEAEAFFASYALPPQRGLRFRDGRRPITGDLLGEIPYANNGYYLSSDSLVGVLPLHEAGAFYIQEPSAMTAAAVLAPKDGERVLDLCAAPGGKSTQLALSADLALLVANEPIPARAQILSRNIERMGITNAVVTSAFPEALSAKWPQFFDKVLVDAPCSGEGMFRKHPETRAEWTPDAPIRCAQRQRSILYHAALMLRPGGRLVYSTCTFNSHENEETIEAFLEAHPNFRLVPFSLPGLPMASAGMLRLWPHHIKGEGHFVALLEKDGLLSIEGAPAPTVPLPLPNKNDTAAYMRFCSEVQPFPSLPANAVFAGRILSVPGVLPPLDHLRTLRVGLQLGEARGRIFVPDHAFALAIPMKQSIALQDAEQTAAYLHGDTLPCSDELHGYHVVTVQGYQLGFVKASDGLLKNHYPKGLRKP